jgi:hypothetical protein
MAENRLPKQVLECILAGRRKGKTRNLVDEEQCKRKD